MTRTCLTTFSILLCCCIARADSLLLVDGSEIQYATLIKRPDGYWIKLSSGESRIIAASQVKELRSTAGGGGDTAGGATGGSSNSAAESESSGAARSDSFKSLKSRADRADASVAAVVLWEKWIQANPQSPDLAAARSELQKWQQLHNGAAEKIGSKWIAGAEKQRLMERVDKLIDEGRAMLAGSQSIDGVKKFEEALRLYPNSFDANFELGYYYLSKGAQPPGNPAYFDKAATLIEAAARQRPKSAACWSNLSIVSNFRKKYEQSVVLAYKAARIRDDKDIVQNLVNSIAHAPPGMQRNNTKIKPMLEDAQILARKHNIGLQGAEWKYIRPVAEDETQIVSAAGDGDIDEGPVGQAWTGSGFFISPDGYLLTNHHVITGDPKSKVKKNIAFRARHDDGTETNAELVAVDDDADLALMKVNVDRPVPYLKLADDNPRQASKLLVLGYPTTGQSVKGLQISEGTVKSINPGDTHEVWMELNTTHGNSGGPIVDKSGRVVAVLTAGRQVHNMTIVLGVGPKQIKKFFDKIAAKAPQSLSWEPAGTREFDGEKLTEEARKSTLLVIAVRMDKADAGGP